MRLLIFIVILLVIDIYTFQALKTVTYNWSRNPKLIATVVYFLVTILAMIYFFGNTRNWYDHFPRNAKIYATALVFIIFFSKFSVAIFVVLDDLRRLVLFLANLWPSTENYDLGQISLCGSVRSCSRCYSTG